MAYESRNVEHTNVWRETPNSRELIFNPSHPMNADGQIQEGKFINGGQKSHSSLHLTTESGHMLSIYFAPELFSKKGLNEQHYLDAVKNNPKSPPVEFTHVKPGGGFISSTNMETANQLALKILEQLDKEKGITNGYKLAQMAITDQNKTQKTTV